MSWAALPAEGKLLAALLALMVLDVLTGWLAAAINGGLSSRASWAGVSRKALTMVVVIVVGIVNTIAPSPIDQFPLLIPTLIGYIGGEVYSILENAKKSGVPLPAPLDAAFRARKELQP